MVRQTINDCIHRRDKVTSAGELKTAELMTLLLNAAAAAKHALGDPSCVGLRCDFCRHLVPVTYLVRNGYRRPCPEPLLLVLK